MPGCINQRKHSQQSQGHAALRITPPNQPTQQSPTTSPSSPNPAPHLVHSEEHDGVGGRGAHEAGAEAAVEPGHAAWWAVRGGRRAT